MRKKRAAQTRQRVVIATAEAINELSFEKASLSEIAERACVSKGAISHHFPNKDALALEVMAAQNSYSQRKAMATVNEGGPAIETLLRVSADVMYDIVEDPLVRAGIRLTTIEIRLVEAPPIEIWRQWTEFNIMLLTKAQEEGSLKAEVDILDTASLIVSDLVGLILFSYIQGEDMAGLPVGVHAMWQTFIRANISEVEAKRVEALCTEFFLERRLRPALTTAEILDLHLKPADFEL